MWEGREQKAGLTSLALLVMYVQTDLRSAAQTGFSASLSAPPPTLCCHGERPVRSQA